MKKALLTIIAIAAATNILNAGTYTWTGSAGDGLWFTAGNWNYDGAPAATSPGNSVTDDVVINGENVVVEYVPGGDWNMQGAITISGGARLVQTTGDNYATISGTMILDGGTYDAGTSTGLTLNGRLKVYDGGELASNVALGRGSASVLELHGGKVPVYSGDYTLASYPNDIYDGGTFTLTNELRPPAGDRTWEGTHWVCKMFSPRGAGVHTFRSGSLTTTTTTYSGYYQNKSYINIPADSTASFTWNYKASEIYSKLWSGDAPRFRYGGSTLTQDEFESYFECIDDGGKAPCTFRLAVVSPYGITSPSATDVGETSATISAFVSSTAEGASVYALWGASVAATDDLSAWDHSQSLGTAVANETFSETLTGLTEEVPVYYAFAIVTNGAVAAATAVKSFTPSAYSAVFTGAAGDGLWATAGNWRSGVVPTVADTIRIDANCTRSGDINLQEWNITVNGASFVCTAELNPGPRTVLNGSITAVTFIAGGTGNALVVRGSSVVSTRTSKLGQAPRGLFGADPHFDFRSGAPCSYTYAYDPESDPPAFETEFNAIFVGGKILVDGAALTAADIGRVSYSTNTTDHTVTLTLLETTVNAAFASTASASVSGLSATLSAPVEVGGAKPLYLLFGTDPANLVETLVVAEAADATTYTFTTNGVEGTLYHYKFRLGEADDPDAVFDTAIPQSLFASVSGNLFTGDANEHANDARNWSKGAVPSALDLVYVIEDVAKRGTMQWDLENATVAGWVQIGERVNFHTNPSNALTITGNASLSGGANWTHLGPSETPETIVNVAVGGDLTLSSDSLIQAGTISDTAAQQSRGWTRGCGPGYNRYAGGTHAGDGGHIPTADVPSLVSYGKILDPLWWGSGGWGNGDAYAGGGVVKLAVGGTLTADGTICSRGFGYPLDSEEFVGGAGSGGSVNITAGALAGSGAIDANGGNNGLYGPGSGGRVKVALTGAGSTFADFNGTIEAIGGSMQNQTQAATWDVSPAAAGTVCLQTAGADPVVKVYNVWRYGNNPAAWRVATNETAVASGTHLPAKQNGDFPSALKRTSWELSGNGAIRLTADVRIASLSLAASDGSQCIYTDGHKLTVGSFVVGGVNRRYGVYTAATDPGLIFGSGSIEVPSGGMVILVR